MFLTWLSDFLLDRPHNHLPTTLTQAHSDQANSVFLFLSKTPLYVNVTSPTSMEKSAIMASDGNNVDLDDINMMDISPPRMAGNKRAAASSPAITPPGLGNPCFLTQPDAALENCDTELRPAPLADKFEVPPKKKSSANPTNPTVASTQLEEDSVDEGINLLDPGIYEDLISEPHPPTPGEWWPYDFDDEDEGTLNILYQLNGLKLEEVLRQKTVRCKQHDRSQAHPKWGPFHLIWADNQAEVNIVNKKGKKALTFTFDDYLIRTGDLVFDTADDSTYTLLCYAGPKLVTSQVHEAKQLAALSRDDNGPFRLSRDPSDKKLICILDSEGVRYTFDLLVTPRLKNEECIPVGQQGSCALKRILSYKQGLAKQSTTPMVASTNRFSLLADDEAHTQCNSVGNTRNKITRPSISILKSTQKVQNPKSTRMVDDNFSNIHKAARSSGDSESDSQRDSKEEEDSKASENHEDMDNASIKSSEKEQLDKTDDDIIQQEETD